MFEENQLLVPFVYNKHFTRYFRFKDDLLSCGYVGLCKACKRFDESKGFRFTTFSSKCVINEMRMFLRKELKHYNNRVDDIDKVNVTVMNNDEMGEIIKRFTRV